MTPQQAAAALLFIGIASLPPSSFASEPSGGHVPEVVSLGEFPASGHSYNVDFGEAKFCLDFISDKGLTYTSLVDPIITETVKIVVTPLRQNLFMVVWTEKAGTRVIHIEDFDQRVIYTNIIRKDGTFVCMKGPITQLK